MKAKTESQYRNAWNNHIAELTSLLVESSIPVSEWDIILLPLRNAVDTAANKLRDEGEWADIDFPSTDSPSTDIGTYDTFDGKYHG